MREKPIKNKWKSWVSSLDFSDFFLRKRQYSMCKDHQQKKPETTDIDMTSSSISCRMMRRRWIVSMNDVNVSEDCYSYPSWKVDVCSTLGGLETTMTSDVFCLVFVDGEMNGFDLAGATTIWIEERERLRFKKALFYRLRLPWSRAISTRTFLSLVWTMSRWRSMNRSRWILSMKYFCWVKHRPFAEANEQMRHSWKVYLLLCRWWRCVLLADGSREFAASVFFVDVEISMISCTVAIVVETRFIRRWRDSIESFSN